MRLVILSDTQGHHLELKTMPAGDILIHAGDLTNDGSHIEIQWFSRWMQEQPYRKKIVIAGNHDLAFQNDPYTSQAMLKKCVYLEHECKRTLGLKVFGSPWTSAFCQWAFMTNTDQEREALWSQIPSNLDILITHGPPYGILDKDVHKTHLGDRVLRKHVLRARPKLHIFGHIHENYGFHTENGITFINAALCDNENRLAHAPIVYDLS
jgi:Icc-related predicted phosphoesterase